MIQWMETFLMKGVRNKTPNNWIMEAFNLEIINAGPILTDLRSRIESFDVSPNLYLSRSQKDHQPDPSAAKPKINALGIHEAILPEILQLLGIRSLTLSARHDLGPLANLSVDIPNAASEPYLWRYVRNKVVIRELQLLFQNCQTIAFNDWSSLAGGCDLWDGLLSDVIKPIGKKDFEFIFYLGDPLTKLSFQVDEALDIISDFSLYGRVTFALDEGEAIKLWMVLNGVHSDTPVTNQNFPDLKRKYVSIFRRMNIARLLIYSANDAILFTKQAQFVLTRRKVAQAIEIAPDARQNFIEGFSIGLLLQLDLVHCLALGLIVFGSYGELRTSQDQKNLITYINRWIEDLQKPETMYLYQ
jgi:hypothetical protein